MRHIGNFLFLCILGVGLYLYRAPLIAGWENLYATYLPCRKPLAYNLDSFDTRFGISRETFLTAIEKAEAVWEEPTGKNLFSRESAGGLKVNLVFDYRQEATQKLRELGFSVDKDQGSYDALTERYRILKAGLDAKKSAYESLIAEIERRSAAYNAEVAEWNRKKGAPRSVVARLDAESAAITEEVRRARDSEAELKALVDETNAVVTVINQVANSINASAEEFNRIGKERGQEFTEGLYTRDADGRRIDIYQFNTESELVRVLAHEFGHALSLEHVENPKAIMYRLNQGKNAKLADADIAAVKTRCKIK